MLRRTNSVKAANSPNATPKPKAKSPANDEQSRLFMSMVENCDGGRTITASPFMQAYRWKSHDVFPHSDYVDRIRSIAFNEGILGDQTQNKIVHLAQTLYNEETTLTTRFKSSSFNSNVFKALYGLSGDIVDKSAFGNYTFNRVQAFIMLDIIISVTRASPPSPRQEPSTPSITDDTDPRSVIDRAGSLAAVMESVQDPGGSLSKALGNCWETTPADGAQMDVDLTDAETPQQKIYLAMIDCLLETPRNPLNKIGYQYRIAENIHRAVFSIWWYLQRGHMETDSLFHELIADSTRMKFNMDFRTQLPTKLNNTLQPAEAMKPLQIACFINPITLFSTKQLSRIHYKKQAIIQLTSLLSKTRPTADSADSETFETIEHELWKAMVTAAGGSERLDTCMLNFKTKLYSTLPLSQPPPGSSLPSQPEQTQPEQAQPQPAQTQQPQPPPLQKPHTQSQSQQGSSRASSDGSSSVPTKFKQHAHSPLSPVVSDGPKSPLASRVILSAAGGRSKTSSSPAPNAIASSSKLKSNDDHRTSSAISPMSQPPPLIPTNGHFMPHLGIPSASSSPSNTSFLVSPQSAMAVPRARPDPSPTTPTLKKPNPKVKHELRDTAIPRISTSSQSASARPSQKPPIELPMSRMTQHSPPDNVMDVDSFTPSPLTPPTPVSMPLQVVPPPNKELERLRSLVQHLQKLNAAKETSIQSVIAEKQASLQSADSLRAALEKANQAETQHLLELDDLQKVKSSLESQLEKEGEIKADMQKRSHETISHYEAERVSLTQSLTSIRKEHQEIQQKYEELCSTLRSERDASQLSVTEVQQKFNESNQALGVLRDSSQRTIQELQQENEKLKQQYEGEREIGKSSVAELERRCKRLEDTQVSAQKHLKVMTTNNEELQKTVQALQETNRGLLQEKGRLEGESGKHDERQRQDHQELAQLRKRLDEALSTTSELKKQNEAMLVDKSAAQETCHRLGQEVAKLNESLKKTSDTSVAEKKAMSAELEVVKSESERLKAQLAASVAGLAALKDSHGSAQTRLEERLKQVSAASEKLQAANDTLESEKFALIASNDLLSVEKSHAASEAVRHKQERDTAVEFWMDIQKRLDASVSDIEELQSQVKDLTVQNGRVKGEVHELTDARAKLEKDVSKLNEEKLELKKAKEELTNRCTEASKAEATLLKQKKELADDRDALLKSIDILKSKNAELESQYRSLSSGQVESKEVENALRQQLEKLASDNKEFQQKAQTLAEEKNALLTSLDQQKEEMKKQVEKLTSDKEDFQRKAQTLEEEKGALLFSLEQRKEENAKQVEMFASDKEEFQRKARTFAEEKAALQLSLDQQKEEMKKQVEKLTADSEEFRQKAQRLEEEKGALLFSLEQRKEEDKKQVEKLTSDSEEYQQKARAFAEEKAALLLSLDQQKEETKKQVERLTADNEEVRQKAQRLEEEKGALLFSLEQRKEEDKKQVEKLTSDSDGFRQKAQRLEDEKGALLFSLEQQKEEMKKQVEKLTSDNEEVRQKAQMLEEEKGALLFSLEQRKEEDKKQVEKLTFDSDGFQQKAQRLEEEKSALLFSLEQRKEEDKKQVDKLISDSEEYQQKAQTLEEEKGALLFSLEQQKEENKRLFAELQGQSGASDEDVERLRTQSIQLEEARQQLLKRCRTLESSLAESEQRVLEATSTASKEEEKLARENANLSRELARLTETHNKTVADKDKTLRRQAELSKNAESAEEEARRRLADVTRLEGELAESKRALAQQKAEMDETTATVRTSLDRFKEDLVLLRNKGKKTEEDARRKDEEASMAKEKMEKEIAFLRKKVDDLAQDNSKLRMESLSLNQSSSHRERRNSTSVSGPPLESNQIPFPLSHSTTSRPTYPFHKSNASATNADAISPTSSTSSISVTTAGVKRKRVSMSEDDPSFTSEVPSRFGLKTRGFCR